MTEGGYKSSKYAAKINWKLDKGQFQYDPFVGIGFELAPDAAYIDISSSTGIRFAYKGTFGKRDTCDIKIECGDITQPGADYSYNLEPSSDWKEITITWDKFLQPWWVTKKDQVPLNLRKINKIQWQIHGESGATGELWIDDVHLIGYSIPRTKTIYKRVTSSLSPSPIYSYRVRDNEILLDLHPLKRGEVKLFLYDLHGRLILKKKENVKDNSTMTISFRDKMVNKCYLIYLKSSENKWYDKIIVDK
ncbi:MAG: CIA30 family protein [Chitinispirillaceae bacterium]|nr:CIA30 family protein [Chitinispirillaceae bacterium]